MTQEPGPERTDQPGIDLNKPRPGASQQPPAYPPPPAGWSSAPPPPPPSPTGATPYQTTPPRPGHQQPPQGQYPGQPSGQHPAQQGYGPASWQGTPGRPSTGEERLWAGAAHWSALIAMAVAMAFLGPLVVLLVKGNESPHVRRQAVESLNFQLTILIAGLVSFVLAFVVVGFFLLPVVGVIWLVFTIIGAVKASAGEDYRYPMTIRMVR